MDHLQNRGLLELDYIMFGAGSSEDHLRSLHDEGGDSTGNFENAASSDDRFAAIEQVQKDMMA